MTLSRFRTIIAISITTLLASCACQENYDKVPAEAVAEYDVLYSHDIKESFGSVGNFLPSKAVVHFNNNGLSIESKGALGMYKMSIICTTTDAFVTFNYDVHKLIIPLEGINSLMSGISLSDSINIIRKDTKYTQVCGMEATDIEMVSRSPFGDVNISAFYVPTEDNGNRLSLGNIKIPGLPTTLNISSGESNIVVRLKSIHAEKVDDEIFARPAGYIEVSIEEFDAIAESLNLKPESASNLQDYLPSPK